MRETETDSNRNVSSKHDSICKLSAKVREDDFLHNFMLVYPEFISSEFNGTCSQVSV